MSKKLRNRFLALTCVLIFIGLGALYYTNWVVQRPFAIILFVGDGLTTSQLPAARLYRDGADHRLQIESLPHVAILTTYANDFAVSDPAAAASALATGQRVNNRTLSVDPAGNPLPALFELAQRSGRVTGLVTNAALTDPAPAAFYAKTETPLDHLEVARQLVDDIDLSVILGGGESSFLPEGKDGTRTDGRDLMLEMRRQGYEVVRSERELSDTPGWKFPRVFGVFSRGNLEFAGEDQGRLGQPTLAELVTRAISLLQYNPQGYLLVVDASLIAKAAGHNEGERVLREINELDRAVSAALRYAGEDALIIVTGKQSVGGFHLNGYPFKNDRGVSVLGTNADGVPLITWSSGPGSEGQPTAANTAAAIGTVEDTIAVSTGPGSESLQGFKDNTDVFRVIQENL
ncbi:MAG: alkaline phosphatase [Chthoniobacterales bacterium]